MLLPFCVLMAFNLAFLLTWTIADPLHWERVETGRTKAGVLSSYGHCRSFGNLSSIMLGLLAGVNIAALLSANVLAYMTRLLEVAFNESKFVGLAMASILQAALIGLPLLFLADSNPVARYVVRSVLVFVICMSVLVFIFVPKVMNADEKMTIRFSTSGASKRQSYEPADHSGDLNIRISGLKMESIPEVPSGSGPSGHSSDPDFKVSVDDLKKESDTAEVSTNSH